MKDIDTVAYYPGCSLQGLSRPYDKSTRLVCAKLGIRLVDIPDWSCCGATSAHTVDPALNLAINARNLQLARKTGATLVMAPCAACFSNLRRTAVALRDDAVRQDICELLGEDVADIEVLHLSEMLALPAVSAKVRQQVVRRFQGLKVACYYGCLTVRPFQTVRFDDSENPQSLDQILEMTGAVCVDWSHKTECCGAGFAASEPSLVAIRTEEIVSQALEAGAEVLVVTCPLCHTNMEMSFHRLGRLDIPVAFVSQLIGLALGFSADQLGLHNLLANTFSWRERMG